MKNYDVLTTAQKTLDHTKKLATMLKAKGFDVRLEVADNDPFSFLIDIDEHTFLVVYDTEVELFHKTKVKDDYTILRRFFDKTTFKPSQVIHAVIDLAKSI